VDVPKHVHFLCTLGKSGENPYSATFVESQQAAVESQLAVAVESTVSTTVVSASFAVALLAALLPQAAKEIAAKAANAKTNFFIFFTF
jgi:hypothetical protein